MRSEDNAHIVDTEEAIAKCHLCQRFWVVTGTEVDSWIVDNLVKELEYTQDVRLGEK